MLNNVMLAGRVAKEIEIKEYSDGRKVAYLTLAVPRPFKNAEGEYETDFIDCTLWQMIATNTAEYCKKGDTVGVKGRLQNDVITNDDGDIIGKTTVVVAEKVTFLSTKKEEQMVYF